MIPLGIIAVNLTIQTVKDVGLFPTAYAQDDVQKVALCALNGSQCASMQIDQLTPSGGVTWAVAVSDVSGQPLR